MLEKPDVKRRRSRIFEEDVFNPIKKKKKYAPIIPLISTLLLNLDFPKMAIHFFPPRILDVEESISN